MTYRLALLGVLASAGLWAQSTGRLSGTVLDPNDAIVAGAEVTCRDTDTGVTLRTTVTHDGIFWFPELPIGIYEVTVTHPGFQTLVRSGIEMFTGHTVDLKLQLHIGSVRESVEVTSTIPPLQSISSEVQTTIDSRFMRELPLNGRNPMELVVLTPGADFTDVGIVGNVQTNGTVENQQDNLGVSVNGLRSTDNSYKLDGANYNNPQFGSAPTLPNPDTLEEFTVQSSNFNAVESGAGAVVQLSTRSGTNHFHGAAFEFLRNDDLDARNFFGVQRMPFRRNQFGGTVGGPVIRNKLFFFGSYQGTIAVGGPNPKPLNVPSLAQREGDFSAQASKIIVDPLTGQIFPNNQIPRSRFDPVALALLKMYPAPNTGLYTANVPMDTGQNDKQALGKIDYELGAKDHLSGRYFWDQNILKRDFGSMPGIYSNNGFYNKILSVRDTHTFASGLSVIFSFSYSQTNRVEVPVTPVFVQDFTDKVPLGTLQTKPELRMSVNGYGSLSTGGPLQMNPRTWQSRVQSAWAHGEHMVQFGLDFAHDYEWAQDGSSGSGSFTFNGTRTANNAIKGSVGDGFASFLLGLPTTVSQTGSDSVGLSQNSYQPWIQDDWKVRPYLTLNMGVRWEPWLPASDGTGPLTGFVPGVKSMLVPDSPLGLIFSGDTRNSIIPADWNNFSPRLGFAWKVKEQTVIRGGFGIYYRNVPLQLERSASPPFRAYSITLNSPTSLEDPYKSYGGSPFPFTQPSPSELSTYKFPKPLTATAMDPTARTSYTESWNLTVERRLPLDVTASLAYVGNHSLKIIAATEGNPAIYRPGATTGNVDSRRIYPGLASVVLYSPFQSGYYDAMQFSVIRRSHRGVAVMANYVFGKSMDYGTNWLTGQRSGIPRDPFNLQLSKGVSDTDVSHRLNLSIVYDVPKITRARLLGAVVNGWQLNAIATLRTGLPFSVLTGSDRSLVGINKDDADQVGDPTRLDGADPVQQYFNKAAFAVNALGTFGTSGRNILRGPGMQVVNFSTFKNFGITEKLRLQFRFEAFNLLNRANFYNPINNMANASFDKILAARDPRVIQLGAKILF